MMLELFIDKKWGASYNVKSCLQEPPQFHSLQALCCRDVSVINTMPPLNSGICP